MMKEKNSLENGYKIISSLKYKFSTLNNSNKLYSWQFSYFTSNF